jgi:hypothetical protein
VNILGMGVLFSRGRGIDTLRQALTVGWQEPAVVTIKGRTIEWIWSSFRTKPCSRD